MSGIRTEVSSGVMTIVLNRPEKKNAITNAMYGEIADALNHAASDPSVGAVLLRGEGADFCSGNDIGMFAEASAGTVDIHESNTGTFLTAITTFPKPLVAAVTGRAIGVGVTMLFHCDLVYVAHDCQLRTPFIDLALVPEAASAYTIPARIGHVTAFALFALGDPIGADEAVALGIANRAVPAAEVAGIAAAAAKALAAKPLSALIATKRLMRDAEAIAAAIDAESQAFADQLKTPEAAAAFAAFAARKAPRA